jgi:hypothetical protein
VRRVDGFELVVGMERWLLIPATTACFNLLYHPLC